VSLEKGRLGMSSLGVSRAASVIAVVGLAAAVLPPKAAAQGVGPYQFHALTPCRVVNTQKNLPLGSTPLNDQETRSFAVQGTTCGVPVGAKAITGNVTVVSPNGPGYLSLFPSGISKPQVSTINFNAGEPALANGAIVPLADQSLFPSDLSVFAKVGVTGGKVNVILDVTGYFE